MVETLTIPLLDLPAVEEHDTEDLAEVVDWWAHYADEPVVIGTKTGRLQSTLRYTCPDTVHLHPTERASYLARLHSVLMMLDPTWVLDADWWHEPTPPYPEAQWTQPVDWLVDESRRLAFETHPLHDSTAYLTLSWQPPKAHRRWLRDLFLTRGAAGAR